MSNVKYLEDGTIDLQALYNKEFEMKDIHKEDLFNDAAARGNEKAINFIEEEAQKEVSFTLDKGKATERTSTKLQSISAYRAAYLKKYAGYQTKTQQSYTEKAIEKRNQDKKKISDMAAAARAKLKKK